MKRQLIMLSALVTSAILVTACSAPAAAPAPTSAPAATTAPTAMPAATNTAEPTMAPTAASTEAATAGAAAATIPDSAKVMVADSSLGKILVDDKGMVLYMYTKDTAGTSNCYDKCATAWPPLLTKNMATAGDGADASLLGTTTRKDGSMQVTYKAMPLYYYAKDKAPGDTTGQDVGKVWYVLGPAGEVIGMAQTGAAPSSNAAATLTVAKTSLGQVLVGDKGMTLYMYTKDTDNMSNCYDKCATAWPPLLVKDKPTGGDGVDASLLGTTTRTDGSMQVTYNKMPLYYYAKDTAAGDTTGQDVGKVWYVVDPTGKVIK